MTNSSFLQNSLLVPKVYDEFTSQYTLMTEWVDGQRLIDMNVRSPEGKKTISMLLNAYLVQLLETGLLHADPHLGNFLMADDGRLCVLDYGLMTEVLVRRPLPCPVDPSPPPPPLAPTAFQTCY